MNLRKQYAIPIIERKHLQLDHQRLLIGIPMTGLIRAEWALCRWGQVIPTNWSAADMIRYLDQYSPIRFTVADARNLIANAVIDQNFEWLWFIDHDVVLPPLTTVMLNEYIIHKTHPIVAGLYFTRSVPASPLVYRGHGTGHYADWKFGDVVECDGHGMGCTLIHNSILREMAKISEEYTVEGMKVKKIFTTPQRIFYDPEKNAFALAQGTEDLEFLDRVIKNDILTKAGWKKLAKKQYPFIVDTNIFCRHIDPTGKQYPINGEERDYAPKVKKTRGKSLR